MIGRVSTQSFHFFSPSVLECSIVAKCCLVLRRVLWSILKSTTTITYHYYLFFIMMLPGFIFFIY